MSQILGLIHSESLRDFPSPLIALVSSRELVLCIIFSLSLLRIVLIFSINSDLRHPLERSTSMRYLNHIGLGLCDLIRSIYGLSQRIYLEHPILRIEL